VLVNRPTPPAPPLSALIAELRAQVQHRAHQAGSLSAIDVLIFALLSRLLGMVGAWHPTHLPFPGHGTPGPHHALTRTPHAYTRPSRSECCLARILYVLGPAPNTGMRALPAEPPAPRHTPPIRPPPIRSPPRRVGSNAPATQSPTCAYKITIPK